MCWAGGVVAMQNIDMLFQMTFFFIMILMFAEALTHLKTFMGRFLEMNPQLSHGDDLTQRRDCSPAAREGERRI